MVAPLIDARLFLPHKHTYTHSHAHMHAHTQVMPNSGVSVSNVDMTDMAAVRAAVVPGKTKLIMVESPTNPRMQVSGGCMFIWG